MRKYLTLQKDYTIKLQSQITRYSSPKYVYVPVSKEDPLLCKKEVLKEEKLTNFVVSPVSGTITGSKYCMDVNGNLVSCLSILNNYQENFFHRTAALKDLRKVPLEKYIIDLEEHLCFDIARKLRKVNQNSVLILNVVEDEPYVANEIFINKEYTNDILSVLDIMREKLMVCKTMIVVKNNDRENIVSLEDKLGTYTEMELCLVPDYYLIGQEPFLSEYFQIREECILFTPSELLTIMKVVQKKRYETEVIFTVSGNGIKNPQIMEAKVGTLVSDIFADCIKIPKESKVSYVFNGLMKGKTGILEHLIVTKDLKSILVMKEECLEELECISCGKCVSVCPVSCNPKRVYDKGDLKDASRCIQCGLCSYVCPSHINLRKYLKGEKNDGRTS